MIHPDPKSQPTKGAMADGCEKPIAHNAGCRIDFWANAFQAGQNVGWDKWYFAAPAHQQLLDFPDGGPALEAIR